MRHSEKLSLAIVLASFLISSYFYLQLPERIASHWGISGEVDGYMPKFFGLFIMPFVSLLVLLLFMVIPKIDPFKKSYGKFRGYFDRFVLLIIIFFFYLELVTILWNVGFVFNILQVLSPAFAILFYYAGILTENAKRNWFVGFKTPWTLSSEKVWDKTNKLGGKMFKIVGIVALFGLFLPTYALILAVALAVIFSIYVFVYSYFEYKKK